MGKAVQKKYADILHGSRPEPSYRHPRMTLSNRAKIFSPFSALRGYEEEIAAEGEEHLKVTKIELSEEDKGKLSDKLLQVKKGMEVTVCFFEADDVEPAIFDTPAEPARSATLINNWELNQVYSSADNPGRRSDSGTFHRPIPHVHPILLIRMSFYDLLCAFYDGNMSLP